MVYRCEYKTPKGFDNIIMESDGEFLTKLYFEKSEVCDGDKNLPIFTQTSKWLDIYFSGQNPDFTPKYKIENATPFGRMVIDIMKEIPYGKTCFYNDIAKQIAKTRNVKRMSAQAVRRSCGKKPNLHYYSVP